MKKQQKLKIPLTSKGLAKLPVSKIFYVNNNGLELLRDRIVKEMGIEVR